MDGSRQVDRTSQYSVLGATVHTVRALATAQSCGHTLTLGRADRLQPTVYSNCERPVSHRSPITRPRPGLLGVWRGGAAGRGRGAIVGVHWRSKGRSGSAVLQCYAISPTCDL
eukprot:scaffold3107_cov155-Isochrysis_galbana.AAC.3